jgi:2-keto-4-pentenoate hydratase
MPFDLHNLAHRMLANYDARTPGAGIGERFDLTADQAYELQTEITQLRERRGEAVIGYKIGCTSRPIQEQLGMSEPIFGRLFATECYRSGVQLSSLRFANLSVEGELAVRLGRDLASTDVSQEACLEAIEAVFPVIELHHYVIPSTVSRGPWLIASGGMHAGFVLAETESRSPGLAPFARGLRVQIDEVVVGAIDDAASLVCPVESLHWLATRLANLGQRLYRGQIVLTGSPLNLYPVDSGRIVVDAPPLGVSHAEINR